MTQSKPWYREPWPWILMAGPALVVVAGFVTFYLAASTFDGMVADDYYKQGLAINKVLERDRAALRLGLRGEGGLRLRATHFAQAGLDQAVMLRRGPSGAWQGELAPLAPGRWQLVLEDEAGTWRLTGQWRLPQERIAQLEPAGGARP